MLALIAAAALCHLDHVGASAAPDPLGRGAWFADATDDAVLLATPRAGVERFGGCAWPSQLVVSSKGQAYVSCRGAGEVQRLRSHEPATAWQVGAEPAALALDEQAHRLYVGLATSNTVVMLDADTGRELARVDTGVEPTAIGLFSKGVAVGSRKSGSVQVFSRALEGPVRRLAARVPALDQGSEISVGIDRFVPAGDGLLLLGPVAEVGDIDKPTYYGSTRGAPVTQDLFVLDEVPQPKVRHLINLVLPDVSGAFYDAASGKLHLTSRGVGGMVSVHLETRSTDLEWELPTGVVGLTADARHVFVLDDADRQLRTRTKLQRAEAIALGEAEGQIWDRVDTMVLGDSKGELARGRMLFHRADDTRISEVPLACASCHREGRDDGRTWLGQAGMRQTPMLAGRDIAHTAPYGWNGGYEHLEDYIDFTIRERMLGSGLPKADLRALARYVREGLRPVLRPSAPVELRASAQRGRLLFHASAAGCSTCHSAGSAFTDGASHDVRSLGQDEREAWERSQPVVRRSSRKAAVRTFDIAITNALGAPMTAGQFIGLGFSPGGQIAGMLSRENEATAGAEAPAPRDPNRLEVGDPMPVKVQRDPNRLEVGDPMPVRRPRDPDVLELADFTGPRLAPAPSRRIVPAPADVLPIRVPASVRQFDTPSLLQVSLTAPYLHDGSAATLDEVFARLGDHMGTISPLSARDRGDLVAYLQTL